MSNKSKTIIGALKAMCRTEDGELGGVEIPMYVVIDHGSADVLGVHFDRKKAEASRDQIIDVYTGTAVEDSSVTVDELIDALSDAGVLNSH